MTCILPEVGCAEKIKHVVFTLKIAIEKKQKAALLGFACSSFLERKGNSYFLVNFHRTFESKPIKSYEIVQQHNQSYLHLVWLTLSTVLFVNVLKRKPLKESIL